MENNKPKISIIIPVYNVAKYLEKCLDSAVNQTLRDIEIICINDGSTDNSGKILDDYAKKDNRIKVIHKKNEGAAVARNLGLDEAIGDYIMFLDSDDFITFDACETAYNTITEDKSDILMYGHSSLVDNVIKTHKKYKTYTHLHSIQNDNGISDELIYIWDKLFKNEFIKSNNIKFLINCKTAEDVVFCWTCYLYKAKISKITTPLYIYRIIRENSLTSGINGVANDLHTFKEFEKQSIYQQQSPEIQYRIIERFCRGHNYYYQKNIDNRIGRKQVDADMKELCKYLESRYPRSELNKLKYYKKFKYRHIKRFFQGIFSMINEPTQKYKVITILGLKIRKNRKDKK